MILIAGALGFLAGYFLHRKHPDIFRNKEKNKLYYAVAIPFLLIAFYAVWATPARSWFEDFVHFVFMFPSCMVLALYLFTALDKEHDVKTVEQPKEKTAEEQLKEILDKNRR